MSPALLFPSTPAANRGRRGLVHYRPSLWILRPAWLVGIGLLLVSVLGTAADSPAAAFDAATRQYERGLFAEALAGYEQLMATGGTSPALCFNAGNAAFRASHPGRAILYYRRAGLMAPRDREIRSNLQFVRSQVKGVPPAAPPLTSRLRPGLTLNQWAIATVAVGWAWIGLWIAVQIQPRWIDRLRRTRSVAGLVLIPLALGLGFTWQEDYLTRHAVVTTGEVNMRQGPLDETHRVQQLRDGQEVVVSDQKNDWYQIRLPDLTVGWVKTNEVSLVIP